MNLIKKLLGKLRFLLFKQFREKKLSEYISEQILNLFGNDKNEINILDYGAGMDPIVASIVYKKLNKGLFKKNITIDCYDFYTDLNIRSLKSKYPYLNFQNFSNFKKNKFIYDFALVLDVLHHADIKNNQKIDEIITNVVKKSKFILIKDHFEYNIISRSILIIMDFIGNFYNNVTIPRNYFNIKKYNNFISRNKLIEINRLTDRTYYKKYWLFFSDPKLHFISILKNND